MPVRALRRMALELQPAVKTSASGRRGLTAIRVAPTSYVLHGARVWRTQPGPDFRNPVQARSATPGAEPNQVGD